MEFKDNKIQNLYANEGGVQIINMHESRRRGETRTSHIGAKITDTQYRQLAEICAAESWTMSDGVEQAITLFLDFYEFGPAKMSQYRNILGAMIRRLKD